MRGRRGGGQEREGGEEGRGGNDTKLLAIHTASVVQTDEAHVNWGP